MTLYHFGNCIALLYAPYHMVYKYSGIAEYGSFSKCVYVGGIYIFTQLFKMLILATFFPDNDSSISGGQYDFFLEFLKASVDFADLVGLSVALSAAPGKGRSKIMTAALGWAGAEMLVTRGLSLWAEARGPSFSWRPAAAAAAGGPALLAAAAAAALLWLRGRRALPASARASAQALLLLYPYRLQIEELAAHVLGLGAGAALGLRAAHAAALALSALAMYAHVDTD